VDGVTVAPEGSTGNNQGSSLTQYFRPGDPTPLRRRCVHGRRV